MLPAAASVDTAVAALIGVAPSDGLRRCPSWPHRQYLPYLTPPAGRIHRPATPSFVSSAPYSSSKAGSTREFSGIDEAAKLEWPGGLELLQAVLR